MLFAVKIPSLFAVSGKINFNIWDWFMKKSIHSTVYDGAWKKYENKIQQCVIFHLNDNNYTHIKILIETSTNWTFI